MNEDFERRMHAFFQSISEELLQTEPLHLPPEGVAAATTLLAYFDDGQLPPGVDAPGVITFDATPNLTFICHATRAELRGGSIGQHTAAWLYFMAGTVAYHLPGEQPRTEEERQVLLAARTLLPLLGAAMSPDLKRVMDMDVLRLNRQADTGVDPDIHHGA